MNLEPLHPLYDRPGPFLSVYLDRTRATEDAARLLAARWQGVREQALRQGAGEADLAAVGRALDEGEPGGGGPHGRGLVATEGEVVVDEVLDPPPAQDEARWSALPHVLPLLAGTANRLPHAVVLVDRLGAEITVHAPEGGTSDAVTGADYPVRKVKPGGWSQRRYQERAENLWERNAKQVADRVATLVRRHRPAVVVVAGDVRARGLLRDAVPEEVRGLLVDLDEGGRAAGVDVAAQRKAIDDVLAERLAGRARAVVEEWREESGQGDRAVEGLEPTVAALREARVATLLLRSDLVEARLWAGPEPLHVGCREEDLTAMGVDRPFQADASAALIRAGAASAADAWILRPDSGVPLRDGVGGILRYRMHG